MQKARLEDWALARAVKDYQEVPVITGKVYGHPRFEDGTEVVTSYIVDHDIKERWVQSANTLYTLGTPKAEYVEWVKEHAPEQAERYGLTGPVNPVSNSEANSATKAAV